MTDGAVQLELEWMGGAPARRLRKRRGGVDELPWGSIDIGAFSEPALLEARKVWTNGAFTEYASAAAFSSMTGAFHTAAPEGPQSCVPARFFCVGIASTGIVNVFQIRLPVAASRAATLPRNLQHGYVGSPAWDSSREDTGTYNRPAYN